MSEGAVIFEATEKHTATIIFLHGLGDTGEGWGETIRDARPSYMKAICPTAPSMPSTINYGYIMPSWFDLETLDMYGTEYSDEIKAAAENITKLIESEISSGISAKRIILGGISQGGALALYTGLTFSQPLGGIIGLSTWLPLHRSFPEAKRIDENVAIFQCHGDMDNVVLYKHGQATHDILKTFMENAQFKSYSGLEHWWCPEEMNDVKNFIKQTVPKHQELA